LFSWKNVSSGGLLSSQYRLLGINARNQLPTCRACCKADQRLVEALFGNNCHTRLFQNCHHILGICSQTP
jgi:hypothetical protein